MTYDPTQMVASMGGVPIELGTSPRGLPTYKGEVLTGHKVDDFISIKRKEVETDVNFNITFNTRIPQEAVADYWKEVK